MTFVREFMEYKPWGACRILVVVEDDRRCQVQEFLREHAMTHPMEYKKIANSLRRAVSHGPRDIHDEGMCKIVGDVGEFKARRELLRVFWFFADSKQIDNRRVDTIVLTHAARPNKGQEQEREIAKAKIMLARYRECPFPECEGEEETP